MRSLPQLSLVAMGLAACICGASGQTFVDVNQADLIKTAPELRTLEFDSDQGKLDPLLRSTGQQLENMLAKFVNVSIGEEVHEMRFEMAALAWKEHRDTFRYVARTNPFVELRTPEPKSAFLIAGRFMDMLGDLLPETRNQSRFRFLGRISEGGRPSLVIAFAARDGSKEGLVWVDEASKQILRLRTDFLKHPAGENFDSFTRDVRFVPVTFSALKTTLWLPSRAAVHMRFAAGEMHSVHRFSDYVTERTRARGAAANQIPLEEDAFEILLKGVTALEAGKPDDALGPLRDAAARLPDRIEPGYYLGLALYAKHDFPAAEARFRETAQRAPNLAAAHNQLGAVLFETGDKPGALAEFQAALRLDPGNAKMRANLDRAATDPTMDKATIQVNVRQVLVPVVVTDRDGSHVTGLTQADFTVFEDGLQQKIIGFSSERTNAPDRASSGSEPEHLPTPATAGFQQSRHAYVICLDTLHASFGNFVHIREALQKLFREERPGNSDYAVIALGRTLQIVQNSTPDPAKVLATLDGPAFRKLFQASAAGNEIAQYEKELQEIRVACDGGDSSCAPRKTMLPARAREIAEHERLRTGAFLEQFRSVVAQTAGSGRRTLILISDGFSLAPGETAFGLLNAYFPDVQSNPTVQTLRDAMQPIFKLAVKGNVSIYTLDSRGLYTSPSIDISRDVIRTVVAQVDHALDVIAVDQGQTLSEIAAETGGKAFQNSNDLLAGLKKAFADGREYYTLAYVPTNEVQDGKFRKIEVRVRDTKDAVSAKRGYWAASQ